MRQPTSQGGTRVFRLPRGPSAILPGMNLRRAPVGRCGIVAIVLPLSFAGCALGLWPPPAYAHPDLPVTDSTVEVAAGTFVAFPLSAHFHRMVGKIEVIRPGEGTVSVLLMDDPGFASYAAGQLAPYLYSSGRTHEARLNFLIACCTRRLDLGGKFAQQWDPFHLVIDNRESSSAALVKLRAALIHDGAAVVLYNGEPFAAVQVVGFFGAFGIISAFFVIKTARRGPGRARAPDQTGRSERAYALGSLFLFGAASMLAAALAAKGMTSYGGGLVEGLVASQADLQFPAGSLEESLPLFQFLIPLSWLAAVVLWLKSFSLAAVAGSGLAASVGLLEGAGSLVVGVLLAASYGSILLALAMAAVVALSQLLGGLRLLQGTRVLLLAAD